MMAHLFSSWLAPALLATGLLIAAPAAQAQHALRFTSADNDQVVVPTTGINAGSFTYEAWVRYSAPTLLGNYNTLFELGSDERAVYVYGDSSLSLYGGSNSLNTPHHLIVPQRWTHVAVSYDDDKSTIRAYIGGALVYTGVVSFPTSSATELGIGQHFGDTGWQGEIDEVQIWHSARSGAQVQADMRGLVTVNDPNLVAYFKFDEGQGQVAHNQKPGGVDGQLGIDPAADQQDPTWSNANILAAPAALPATTSALGALYPNPAAGTAVAVPFVLPAAGPVSLDVLDALGRPVRTLLRDAARPAGPQQVALDAAALPAGLYTCRLLTAEGTFSRRLVVR